MLANVFKYLLAQHFFLIWAKPAVRPGYLLSTLLIGYALFLGVYMAPTDETQGEVFRIMYVHVPMAVLSLALYVSLAIGCLIYWIWQIKMADIAAQASSLVGATVTFLAIATGSVWGQPTWGTWWMWDARLTTEALLFLLYCAYIALRHFLHPAEYAKKIASIMGFIGIFDVPLVHYSVQWWYTLHQGSTVFHFSEPLISWSMLQPLLLALLGFSSLCFIMVIHTMVVLVRYESFGKDKKQHFSHNNGAIQC